MPKLDGIEIRVAGVPPEERATVGRGVRQRGESASRSNRGLGLAFRTLAVEAHGGRISIEDDAPGAVFCVTIPGSRECSRRSCTAPRSRRNVGALRSSRTSPGLVRAVHSAAGMTTTMGQLVASIFQAYQRELGDEQIAAVATQVRLSDLLGKRPASQRRTKATRRVASAKGAARDR